MPSAFSELRDQHVTALEAARREAPPKAAGRIEQELAYISDTYGADDEPLTDEQAARRSGYVASHKASERALADVGNRSVVDQQVAELRNRYGPPAPAC